jgi:hypothetical protein
MLRIDSEVKYNLNITTLKPDEIRLLVSNAITEYNTENLNDFSATLYGSRLIAAIDNSHSSVVSNETKVYIFKKVIPLIGPVQNIDVALGMALRNDIPQLSNTHITNELRTLFSSPFTLNGETVILEDDGVGQLRIMRATDFGYTFVKDAGFVDYDRGTLQLVNFSCEKFEGAAIRFYALPKDSDITSSFNDILKVEPSEINVTVETVRQ